VRLLLALALSAVALVLVACGSESEGTFEREGFPFTFQYPADFEQVEDVDIDTNLGASADEVAAILLTDDDLIALQRFTLRQAINPSNLGAVKQEFDRLFQQIDPTVDSQASEVAGLLALTIDQIDVPSVDGGQSRYVALFDGDREYLINCQSTPEHREEIEDACDMALDTLTLDEAAE
jgi:hypothetical protein